METARESQRITTLERAAIRSDLPFLAILMGGLYASAFGWRPGAALMIAGLIGRVSGHLISGVSVYRRIMRGTWPQVEPMVDEDDW